MDRSEAQRLKKHGSSWIDAVYLSELRIRFVYELLGSIAFHKKPDFVVTSGIYSSIAARKLFSGANRQCGGNCGHDGVAMIVRDRRRGAT